MAMEHVLVAAETGTFADRKAATDEVAIVLRPSDWGTEP
jgi:hypothetical protein